jgi:hypothetical protein
MIFLFAVVFCGWTPLYIILLINWNHTAVSPLIQDFLLIVPAVSLLIEVDDLFLYNHELRQYFTNKWQMDQITRTRERTRK